MVLSNDAGTNSSIGGVAGRVNTVQYCVALNTGLTMPAGVTNFGRVAGTSGTIARSYGYANGDGTDGMKMNGSIVPNSSWLNVGVNDRDGAHVYRGDGGISFLNAAWWQGPNPQPGWDGTTLLTLKGPTVPGEPIVAP